MNTNELQSTVERYLTTINKTNERITPFAKVPMHDYAQLFSLISSVIKVANASILFMNDNSQQNQVSLINVYDTLDFIHHLTDDLYNEAEFLDKMKSSQ